MKDNDPTVSLAIIGIAGVSLIAALTTQSTEAATNDPFMSQPNKAANSNHEQHKINQLKMKKQVDGGCGAGSCAAKLNKQPTPLRPTNAKSNQH